ncbi:MAG: response regulator [Bacteroidetes bacterium]|nr:response regulator [Bacteroidota bacterium]
METKAKTILIADDDSDYLTIMEANIQSLGFKTITASSQKECETLLDTVKPDLAIFDLMMDNKDSGFILSYKIKNKYPEVPVIIATAVTAETGLVFGINTQTERQWIKADKYMDKGIRKDQLNAEIRKLLKM